MLFRSLWRIRVATLASCLCVCGGSERAAMAHHADAQAVAPSPSPQEASSPATGTMTGIVTDETGGPLPDVRITVTNDATALRREVTTGQEGTFAIPLLPSGRYTVRAERDGFSALDIPGIIFDVTDPVVVRVKLEVASLGEDVVVTARKREERLQDVPASIVAASAQTLTDLNIVSVTELDTVAPGLTFVTNPSRFGSGPSISLRGISTQTQGSGVQDSVGIVIDGVVIERAKAGAFPDLSDIARVEVLRGPQGTLFGKNASAGVISMTTKDPTDEFAADVGVEYGSYDTRTMRASVSGPIVEGRLRARLSAYTKERDGFVENIFDGSKWERDEQKALRGKLVAIPSARDTVKLSLDFVEQQNDGGTNIIRSFTPVTQQYVRDALGSIVGLENSRVNARPLGHNYQRSRGASVQWDRALGQHTLTALGAARTFNQDFHAGTYIWLTPQNDGDQFGFVDQDQYSAEVRIASPVTSRRVDYVAGVFMLDNKTGTGILDPGTLVVGTTTRNSRSQFSVVNTTSYAGFAEANTHLTDRWTITAGARWTHENVDMSVTGLPIAPDRVRFGHPLGTTSGAATTDNVSWRAGASWQWQQNRMLYASVATGFKGRGFNVNTSVLGDPQEVRPETSTSYEAGMKTQRFGGRMTFNVNAYYSLFDDFQAQGGLSLPGSPTTRIILLNAERLVTKGFETEVAASLGRSTEVSMNASYIDATFERFTNAPCYPGQAAIKPSCANNVQDLSGARLPNTPKWSVNMLAKHDVAIPRSAWHATATLDYAWRGNVQWHVLGSPDGIEPAYGLLGATLRLHSDRDRFTLRIFGKNLTDKFHTSGIVVDTQITHFLPPDYRRAVGVDATFKF